MADTSVANRSSEGHSRSRAPDTSDIWSNRRMPDVIEVERTIAATPQRLYELVSDLQRMGEWSPENCGGRWVRGASGPVEWVFRFRPADGLGASTVVTQSYEDRRGRVMTTLGTLVTNVKDRATHNRATMTQTLAGVAATAERG